MSRHSRTRISRPLIAVLGATIAVGAGVYVHNAHKARAAGAARVALMAIEPAVSDVKPATIAPATSIPVNPSPSAAPLIPVPQTALVTQTPSGAKTSAPTTRPVAPVSNNSARTAPAAPPAASPRVAGSAPTTRPAEARVATPAPSPILASANLGPRLLDDAKAKLDAGDLLSARELLNDSLQSGRLSAADAESARRLIAEINQTVIFSKRRFDKDSFVSPYQVRPGERLSKIADKHLVTWELLCRINGLSDPKKLRAGQWIKIPNGPFNCVISKSAYRLDVYLGTPGEAGSLLVTTFPVGLGKDDSTPTGTWLLAPGSKAHPATYYSPRGEGVIAADDPKNPLGGYWMGLTGVSGNALDKNSYGIHGTIDPDSIGKQASMGCIRLGHEDISLLYDLLVDGKSKVVVKD
jgi:lipoprotein-anchoring transpeptidase ErfK/SrfK